MNILRFARVSSLAMVMATGTLATAQAGVAVQIGGPTFSVGFRGGHHGHHRGGWGWGWGWSPLVVSPWVYPQVVSVVPPAPVVVEAPAADPAGPPARPDPVIYPRNGQSAEQTEADRQACNRWATTQPAALADSSVFMRAVEACMDGRGYSMK